MKFLYRSYAESTNKSNSQNTANTTPVAKQIRGNSGFTKAQKELLEITLMTK